LKYSKYNIYNLDSEFYQSPCIKVSNNQNDLIIKDRINHIYPKNKTLCNNECFVNDVDYTNKAFICECDSSKISSQNINYENRFRMKYILDKFNFKLFKCYNHFSKGLSHFNNAIEYIISLFIVLSISLTILFGSALKTTSRCAYHRWNTARTLASISMYVALKDGAAYVVNLQTSIT
jgi:hypothetical protein